MISVFDVFDNCIFFLIVLKKSFTEPKAEGQKQKENVDTVELNH